MKLQLVFDERPRGGGGIGATAQIEKALHQKGIDFTSLLYDEALELANNGNYSEAAEKLRMLLCLSPTDGASSLLLAKILAALKQWQEAMKYLKKAEENSISIPVSISQFIEQGLQRELQNSDIERKKALQRDKTELTRLKKELRHLRSHSSEQKNENAQLVKMVRTWTYRCSVVTGSAIAILFFAFFPPKDEETTEKEATEETETTGTAETTETTPINVEAQANKTEPKPKKTESAVQKTKTKKPVKTPEKYPKIYTVKKGDSLSKISKKFYKTSKYSSKIAKHNNVDPDKIRVGQTLEIPAPPN